MKIPWGGEEPRLLWSPGPPKVGINSEFCQMGKEGTRCQTMTSATGWLMPLGTRTQVCFKLKSASGYCLMKCGLALGKFSSIIKGSCGFSWVKVILDILDFIKPKKQ